MRRIFLFIVFFVFALPVLATDYSKFAEKTYAEENNKENVHITVKKEVIDKYGQEYGSNFIPYIVYGYGDMKAKKMRKSRVTYTCLLDANMLPL